MIDDPRLIIAKIDTDLDLLLSQPQMWGGDEAVEMQFLTYMSIREFILRGPETTELSILRSKAVTSAYFATLTKRFGTCIQPAFCLLNRGLRVTSDEKTRRLCEILSEVRKALEAK